MINKYTAITSDTDCPFVSVVIPTYNGPEFLVAAIESVLTQTYSNLEVVVVDDGSTDNTAEVVLSFKNQVKYIHQKNAGTAAARNTGIKNCTGSIIAFLDHDDLWLPKKLEKELPLLSDQNIGLVYCGRQFFNTYTNEVTSTHPAEPELQVHDFLGHTTIALQSAIVPRAVFDEVGLFDEQLLGTDDWEMSIRIAARYRVVGVPDVLVSIRGHAGQQGIMSERMYTNSMSVLTKHANLHVNCAACRAAIRQSELLIREDYYQRHRRQTKADFGERRYLDGIRGLVRGVARYPQAISRIPRRILEKLIGRKA